MVADITTIVQISKDKIRAGVATLGKEPRMGDLVEYELDKEDLSEVLLGVKKVYGNEKIRVLFDDSLGEIRGSDKGPVFVPGEEIWDKVSEAAKKAGVEIEAIEAESIAKENNSDPMIGLALKEAPLKEKKAQEESVKESELKVAQEEPVKEELEQEQELGVKEAAEEGQPSGPPTEQKSPGVKPLTAEAPIAPIAMAKESGGNGRGKYVFLILAVALIMGVVAGGIIVSRRSTSPSETPASQSAALPSPTEAPEPTPTPELKREELSVRVLNGSGVSGRAGEVAESLEELGYEGVKTGNADAFDYQETVIQLKEDKKMYFEAIKEDLSEYLVAKEAEVLEEDSQFDLIIIVGKEKS